MSFRSPGKIRANTAFGNKTVDMRIPFEVSSEGMENADEARSKEQGLVIFVEHTQNDTADSRKKAIEERAVFKEEVT